MKGYAHLGALQALFEYGIRPEIIAGVSIGAVAGVFIADGKRPEEVLELFMSREFRSFTGFTRSRGGFMNLDNFYGFLRDTLSVGRIEPRKNLPGLVAAWQIVRDRLGPDAPSLVLVGDRDALFAAFQRFEYDSVLAILIVIIAVVLLGEVLANHVKRLFNAQS